MAIKRTLVDLIERITKARIVRPHEIGQVFEQEHLRLFFDQFKVDCVFDVGANVGQYATRIRHRARYKGPIISFEPNPDVARVLKENARHDPCWFVEEVALGSSSGKLKFNVTVGDQLASLHKPKALDVDFFSGHAEISRTIDVTVSTLDIELRKYRDRLGFKRPFLKMDTQGHDIDVALGAGKKLGEFVGLQSELAIEQIYENSPTFYEALRFYTERGFSLSAFVSDHEGWLFPHLLEIDCIMFNKSAWADGE